MKISSLTDIDCTTVALFLTHICDGSGGAGNGACSDWMAMIAQSVIRPTAFFIRRWMDAKTQMTHSLLLNNLNYGVGSHPCERASITARRSRGTSNANWHTSLNKSCCRIFVMAVAEEWCMLWLNGDDPSVSQSTNRLFHSEMDGWCENTDDALTAKQSELHMGLAPIHASERPLPLDAPEELQMQTDKSAWIRVVVAYFDTFFMSSDWGLLLRCFAVGSFISISIFFPGWCVTL